MSQITTIDDGSGLSHKRLKTNKDSLLDAAPKAIRVLKRLLDAESERVQLDAAKALLDRAGLLPTSDRESPLDGNLAELPVGELRRIADKLVAEIAERARPVPRVIDATLANKDGN